VPCKNQMKEERKKRETFLEESVKRETSLLGSRQNLQGRFSEKRKIGEKGFAVPNS